MVSMSAYGGLDEDLKHLLTAHTVYRGQHQEEAFMLSLASPSGNQTVSMVAMSRKQQSD